MRSRARLVAGAERSGIAVAALGRRDRMRALERMLETTGASALAVCADAGTQALVASVAATRNLPFSCASAGADDLLARDLGCPPDDPLQALEALLCTHERTADLAEVNGSVFVNYVAFGLCDRHQPGARHHRRRLRAVAGRARAGFRVPRPEPARRTRPLLVTNNLFDVGPDGLGERGWPDEGLLGVTLFPPGAEDPLHAREGWEESRCAHLELATAEPLHAEVDGEPRLLKPPLRFRSLPRALRVRAGEPAPGPRPATGGMSARSAGADPAYLGPST
jgi:diacylglycerol kinase family enzyme